MGGFFNEVEGISVRGFPTDLVRAPLPCIRASRCSQYVPAGQKTGASGELCAVCCVVHRVLLASHAVQGGRNLELPRRLEFR